jgi:predicted  nucleic acid-binding Zn-ribbon protein
VRIGLNTVTGLDSKVDTLIDSQVRLYDSMQMLSDSMQTLSGSIQRLTDAQGETERKLQRLLDSLRHPDGEHPEN